VFCVQSVPCFLVLWLVLVKWKYEKVCFWCITKCCNQNVDAENVNKKITMFR